MSDLRDFIETLRKAGELIEVDGEADWNLEVAAFGTMLGRMMGKTPALLFNRIKGYPPGYRMLTGHFAGRGFEKPHSRLAMVLGLDPNCSREEFGYELLTRMQSPLKPVEVATGTCKEVIKMGKEASLFDLPFPTYAQGDGGRYSLTQAHITKDPDSDWVNWANYRAMLYSRNRYTIGAQVGVQFDEIFTTKYLARGQSMPVATVIGGDPTIFFVAGMELPPGVSEADVAGGLRHAPLELVRCETSDLLVPADAEVVIEGEVRPGEYLPEGPLTEACLFQASPRVPNYAVRVNCITHRKDPIIPILPQPPMGDAYAFYMAIWIAGFDAQCRLQLGLPVKAGSVAAPVLPVVSGSEAYPGMLRDVVDRLMKAGTYVHLDSLLLVDDDVNVFDLDQVYEAMFTQLNPTRDLWFTDNDRTKVVAMGPYLDDIDMARNYKGTGLLTTKRVMDATTKGNPAVRRINFETSYPSDLQQWVVENWKRLGFKEAPRWSKSYLDTKPMQSL